MKTAKIFLCILLMILLSAQVKAQYNEGEYSMTEPVISGGGARIVEGSLSLESIIGQPVKGSAISAAPFGISSGFWSFTAAPSTAGMLDASFGSGGKVITDLSTSGNARAVAIQADGKIVVAGYASNGTDNDFVAVRYNSDGTLDNSFGTAGVARANFSATTITVTL